MGRKPCCDKVGLKKGRWSAEEDQLLADYIVANGEGSWKSLPQNAGLKRCGKSCRLRWVNYLKSDIKRGNISTAEAETILNLHTCLGNRWSTIASQLSGRTDNEIKNYWNSHLSRNTHSFIRPTATPPSLATLVADVSKVGTTVVANTKRGRKTNNSSSKRTKNGKTNISKDTSKNVVSEPSVVEKAVITVSEPETGLATTTKHPSPISYISEETTCSRVMKEQKYNASLSWATEIPATPWEKVLPLDEQWDMDKDWDDVMSYCTKTSTMDSTVDPLIGWSWELYAGDGGLEAGRHNGVLEFDDHDNDDDEKQTAFVNWLLS